MLGDTSWSPLDQRRERRGVHLLVVSSFDTVLGGGVGHLPIASPDTVVSGIVHTLPLSGVDLQPLLGCIADLPFRFSVNFASIIGKTPNSPHGPLGADLSPFSVRGMMGVNVEEYEPRADYS